MPRLLIVVAAAADIRVSQLALCWRQRKYLICVAFQAEAEAPSSLHNWPLAFFPSSYIYIFFVVVAYFHHYCKSVVLLLYLCFRISEPHLRIMSQVNWGDNCGAVEAGRRQRLRTPDRLVTLDPVEWPQVMGFWSFYVLAGRRDSASPLAADSQAQVTAKWFSVFKLTTQICKGARAVGFGPH